MSDTVFAAPCKRHLRYAQRCAISALLLGCSAITANAAAPSSRYAQLAADRSIAPGSAVVLSVEVDLAKNSALYVQSDGWFAPQG
ncbi:MAG: hypothetical protein ACREO8_07915, partial [Luteimonas sp.]